MQVLVTRPQPQADATSRALLALGHAPLLDPALVLERLPLPAIDAAAVAAILLTSANAVPSLTSALLSRPIYAVGDATAAAARAAGAKDVRAGRSDGAALAAQVIATLPVDAGELLHLAAEETRPGLAEALEGAGRRYRRAVVYRMVPAGAMPAAVRAALAAGHIEAALFFSPRSAEVWHARLVAAEPGATLRHVQAVCLSAAVADPIRALDWSALRIAPRPTHAALLRCLAEPDARW
jgi:uroporphyrinogen-III synthase